MSDEPRSLRDLVERARDQRGLRGHAGSFDNDYEAMDVERSAKAAWWPFIKLARTWADAFPNWRMPDEPSHAEPL